MAYSSVCQKNGPARPHIEQSRKLLSITVAFMSDRYRDVKALVITEERHV
jgi:hypothetical protein